MTSTKEIDIEYGEILLRRACDNYDPEDQYTRLLTGTMINYLADNDIEFDAHDYYETELYTVTELNLGYRKKYLFVTRNLFEAATLCIFFTLKKVEGVKARLHDLNNDNFYLTDSKIIRALKQDGINYKRVDNRLK